MLLKELEAASIFAARGQTRTYLNGVHVLPDRIEATDGTVACRITTPTEGVPDGGVILPIDEVLAFVKAAKKNDSKTAPRLAVDLSAPNLLKAGTVNIWYAPVDEKFPDLYRVMPADEKLGQQFTNHVNPKLLQRVWDALAALGYTSKTMYPVPSGVAKSGAFVWQYGPEVKMLAMALRG